MIRYKEMTSESIKYHNAYIDDIKDIKIHNAYIDDIKDIKINVVKSTPKSFGKTLQNRGKMNKSRVK